MALPEGLSKPQQQDISINFHKTWQNETAFSAI